MYNTKSKDITKTKSSCILILHLTGQTKHRPIYNFIEPIYWYFRTEKCWSIILSGRWIELLKFY